MVLSLNTSLCLLALILPNLFQRVAIMDEDEDVEEDAAEAQEPIPFHPAALVANLTLKAALRLVHDEVVAQDTADAKVFLTAVDEAFAPVRKCDVVVADSSSIACRATARSSRNPWI